MIFYAGTRAHHWVEGGVGTTRIRTTQEVRQRDVADEEQRDVPVAENIHEVDETLLGVR